MVSPSDHSAIQLGLKFKNSKNNVCIDRDVIDWNLFLDEDFKVSYNEELNNELKSITFEQENKMNYFQLSKAIIKAAKKIALSPEEKSKGLYIYPKIIIQPLVDKRSEVLDSIRQNSLSDEDAISFAREARKKVLEGIEVAKNRWPRHLVDRIHQMAKKSRDSWQAIKTLKEGILGHYKSPDIMCLKKMVLSL